MNAYPDTSFLFAFYVKQTNSSLAASYAAAMAEPLCVGPLLAYEFRQALRFQVWRRLANSREGLTLVAMHIALSRFESDLADGIAILTPCNLQEILLRAGAISASQTIAGGYRSFDVLHVATALHLGAKEFLTFDANQRKLALAEKLRVKP